MATKVWKCDHCYGGFFATQKEALSHEKNCDCNKDSKSCMTCDFYKEMGYPIGGSDMRCQNKDCSLFNENVSYFLEDKNGEDYFPCKFWKEEK